MEDFLAIWRTDSIVSGKKKIDYEWSELFIQVGNFYICTARPDTTVMIIKRYYLRNYSPPIATKQAPHDTTTLSIL